MDTAMAVHGDPLARFEQIIEDILEESFVRLSGTSVQPVTIARHLRRAMEERQAIGVGTLLVPGQYIVRLHPDDLQALQGVSAALTRELATYLAAAAQEAGFRLASAPQVTLLADAAVPKRGIRVEVDPTIAHAPLTQTTQRLPLSDLQQGRGDHASLSLPDGRVITLSRVVTTIGRDLDNHIVVDDPRVSRHHAQIRHQHHRYTLHDLGSTNGTWVNGERVTEVVLHDGDRVCLGGIEGTFVLHRGQDQ
jgi:hypothetical protein